MNKVTYLGELEQMVLLAVLRLQEGAYGMSVRREIEERAGRRVARGAVYVTLDRLAEKSYLTSRLAEPTPERGGRAKRYFEITDDGRDALRTAREALLGLWDGQEAALRGKPGLDPAADEQ